MTPLGTKSVWVADLGIESHLGLLLLLQKNYFRHPIPVDNLKKPACECSSSTRLLNFGICPHWFVLKGVKAIGVPVPSITFVAIGLKHRLYVHIFFE